MSEEIISKPLATRLSKVSMLRNMFQNGKPSPAEELEFNVDFDGEEVLLAKNNIIKFVEHQTNKKKQNAFGKPVKPPKPSKLTYSKKLMNSQSKPNEISSHSESVKNDYFFRAERSCSLDDMKTHGSNLISKSHNSSNANSVHSESINTSSSKIEFIVKKDYISTSNSDSQNSFLKAEQVHIENTTPDSEESYGMDSGINNSKNQIVNSQLSINYNSSGTMISGQSTTDYFSGDIQRDDTFFTGESNNFIPENILSSRSSTRESNQLLGSNENEFTIKPVLPVPLPNDLNVIGQYEDGSYALENGHYFYQVPGIPQVLDEADEDNAEEDKSENNCASQATNKTVQFSLSPITIFSTFSKVDYDRRNNDIDPVRATMELEFEKKLETMEVISVDLKKNQNGFGININAVPMTDEDDQERLGIYIKSITPGGLAEKDGRLKAGDQIIEVNGKSLVGVTHKFSSQVLRGTTGVVKFLIAREKEENQLPSKQEPKETAQEKNQVPIERLSHEDSVEKLRKILAEASATASKAHANRLAEDQEDDEVDNEVQNEDCEPNVNRESSTLDPDVITKEMENLNELERQLDRQLELSFGQNLPLGSIDNIYQSSEDQVEGDYEEVDEELDIFIDNPKDVQITPSSIFSSSITYIASISSPLDSNETFNNEVRIPKEMVEMALMEGRLVLSKSFVENMADMFTWENSLKDENNIVAALFFLATALYQKHLKLISKHKKIRTLGEKLSSHEAAADEAIERLCLRCHSLETRLKSADAKCNKNYNDNESNTDRIVDTHEVNFQDEVKKNEILSKRIDEIQTAYQSALLREKEIQDQLSNFMEKAKTQKNLYEKLVSEANEKIQTLESKLIENYSNSQNGMSSKLICPN